MRQMSLQHDWSKISIKWKILCGYKVIHFCYFIRSQVLNFENTHLVSLHSSRHRLLVLFPRRQLFYQMSKTLFYVSWHFKLIIISSELKVFLNLPPSRDLSVHTVLETQTFEPSITFIPVFLNFIANFWDQWEKIIPLPPAGKILSFPLILSSNNKFISVTKK